MCWGGIILFIEIGKGLRILSAAAVLAAVSAGVGWAQDTEKPNILVIWGDDFRAPHLLPFLRDREIRSAFPF